MIISTNTPAEKQQVSDKASAAIKYLRQGWSAQAFLLLSDPVPEKDPAARFALGLCHICAKEFPQAIPHIEKALNLQKAVFAPSEKATGKWIPENTGRNAETYMKLIGEQITNKTYLTPLDSEFCAKYPKSAEQTFTLALIYAYMHSGMEEQARKVASGLTGQAFEKYMKDLKGYFA